MKVAFHNGNIVHVSTLIESNDVHCSFTHGEVKFLFKVVECREFELHESMTIESMGVPIEEVPSSILALMFDVEEFVDDVCDLLKKEIENRLENDQYETDRKEAGRSAFRHWSSQAAVSL